MPFLAHGFVDGKYLRKAAEAMGIKPVDPHHLIYSIVYDARIQGWSTPHFGAKDIILARTTYYDGRPNDDSDIPDDLRKYWNAN